MKILKTTDFVSERIKVQPVTNAELEKAQTEFEESKKIPFGLTKDDLKGMLEGMPMGIVVRMLEEQEKQGNFPVVKIFQKDIFAERRLSDGSRGGFDWERTEAGFDFWSEVIEKENFNVFFEKYPEYRKYNLD